MKNTEHEVIMKGILADKTKLYAGDCVVIEDAVTGNEMLVAFIEGHLQTRNWPPVITDSYPKVGDVWIKKATEEEQE